MAVDLTLFKKVLGSFATGVTVITTGDNVGGFHGMTASSFASLSLEPCLVLVCIDRESETLTHVRRSQAFNVSILGADQQELSRQFSRKSSPESHGLEGVDYYLGKLGQPLLKASLAYLECKVRDEFAGGDHVIVVGEVIEAEIGSGDEPLAYFRSAYRQLAAGD